MMKNILSILLLLPLFSFHNTELEVHNFQEGEFLKYRVHYGLLNAGFASLRIDETTYNGKPHYHVVGKGSSSGAVRAFYVVDDRYETYIDKASQKPSKFVRKINEGGHTRDQIYTFDHTNKVVTKNDRKRKKVTLHRIESDVQDMLSAFYYLRNHDYKDLKPGKFVGVDVYMGEETFPFKVKVLGKETIDTKFGEIECLKLRPYVQSGRVFEANESVTMWVSNDRNLVPIRIKAELTVGSLKMDIHQYKNIKYPMSFK